ncbi:MAG TPA: dihydrolipoamide acetyltransferase family protein [Egibacteraceae bacterium]
MAIKQFLLPDLGEGLTEGEVVSWLVKPGDQVEVDQPVAEVSTAKAVVEVPSPWAGTVTELHAEPGEEVEVGRPLLSIEVSDTAPTPAPAGPAEEAEPRDAASQPGGVVGGSSQEAEVADMVPQPTSDADGADEDGSGNVLVGYGTRGGARRRRRRGAVAAHGPAPTRPETTPAPAARPLAKPPVRKLAKDLGVDLATVTGTGPGGLITREDVRAAAQAVTAPAAPAPPAAAQPAATTAPPAAGEVRERIPLRGVRKLIAEKMTTSRREIPEATTWVDVDATALWELRQRLNASQDAVRISPLALVLRAVVAGLRAFPQLNARLDADAGEIQLLEPIHLGVATQTDRGLVVPVIRDAHRRTTLELAAELNRLAAGARDGTLPPGELVGGTFTVSNYGSFRVDGGNPVINHPEVAILGVGQIADRPWVVDGELAVRKVLQLSIAFDHRVCDGAEAAGFLRFVADAVEDPASLLAHL